QDLAITYRPSGSVYLVTEPHLRTTESFLDPAVALGVVMDESRSLDIDSPFDLAVADAIALAAAAAAAQRNRQRPAWAPTSGVGVAFGVVMEAAQRGGPTAAPAPEAAMLEIRELAASGVGVLFAAPD